MPSRITGLFQSGDHYRTDAGQRRRGAAGYRAKNRAGDGRDDSQAALDPSDGFFHQTDQLVSDVATLHQLSGQDKKRDTENNRIAEVLDRIRNHERRFVIAGEKKIHRGKKEGKGDGNANNQTQQKEKQPKDNHYLIAPFIYLPPSSTEESGFLASARQKSLKAYIVITIKLNSTAMYSKTRGIFHAGVLGFLIKAYSTRSIVQ